MCDTLIAGKSVTKDGVAVFAKNSDRVPNESQHLESVPAKNHPKNSRVKCTYIEIPQVRHTYATLLSKPYWMWGAEMGVNEYGVVIGNEALYAKEHADTTQKLLGMDLLRLGLERGASAREALQVIIELLEEFGQGGNCFVTKKMSYNNSYLIADSNEAWILETVGKRYAARRANAMDAISNCITTGSNWDMASHDLADYAVKQGWAKSSTEFNFARDFSDFTYTKFSRGNQRRLCNLNEMHRKQGQITVPHMIQALRDHPSGNGNHWQPQDSLFVQDVCMHVGYGPIRDSQSTASMVVHLDSKRPTIFVTGTSAPCTSIFKPIWLDASLPDLGPAPGATYDSKSMFWQHELLHRAVIKDYEPRIAAFATERDALEVQFVEGGLDIANSSSSKRGKFSSDSFSKAKEKEGDWLARVEQVPARPRGSFLYQMAWKKFNQQADMPQIV